MKQLISIVGPTGAGKTAVALQLAQKLACPIISADSVQIYQGLDIGSGKVTKAEMGTISHYLLDFLPPDQDFSAGEFDRQVRSLLEELFLSHEQVILVGGTGLYFQAIWIGFDVMPSIEEAVRAQVNADLETKGLQRLVEELKEVDPETWETIDRNNPARVVRALEVFRGSGKPISAFRKSRLPLLNPWEDVKIGIERPREVLYAGIEARIHQMLAEGWLAEVKGLVETFGEDCKGLQALGYRELLSHLQGKIGYDDAVVLVKRNTRRYAKRQLTWFRRYLDLQWFNPSDFQAIWDCVTNSKDVK